MSDVDDAIERLAGAGLLTERQAEAYVLRDVELVPRSAAAESMGISVNTLDKRLSEARGKTEAAESTTEALQSIQSEDLPTECEECGDALGGRFSERDDGEAVCLDCAELPE